MGYRGSADFGGMITDTFPTGQSDACATMVGSSPSRETFKTNAFLDRKARESGRLSMRSPGKIETAPVRGRFPMRAVTFSRASSEYCSTFRSAEFAGKTGYDGRTMGK